MRIRSLRKNRSRNGRIDSSLRMTSVMFLDAFWEQPFSAALPPARECRATALGPHPRTKAVLPFPRSLGWLVSAFHKTEKEPGTI
jgi:hypothetical protein